MSIVITLDSVKKYRKHSSKEYRWVNRVIFEGEEFVGDGYILTKLLADIIQIYPERRDDEVLVYRGDTLCFQPATLKQWTTKRKQPEWLKKKVGATP